MRQGRIGRTCGSTHEALSLAALAALVVHGLTLLGDGYLHPSLGDIAIPFLSGYETLWTSMGIVAFWALLVLGLSYYARTRIGVQRWRRLHRFAALAWLLGLAHSLGEGTDAGQAWFLAMIALVAVPALGAAARAPARLRARLPQPTRGARRRSRRAPLCAGVALRRAGPTLRRRHKGRRRPMTPSPRTAAQPDAARDRETTRDALRRRTRRIRRSVAGLALALFARRS